MSIIFPPPDDERHRNEPRSLRSEILGWLFLLACADLLIAACL